MDNNLDFEREDLLEQWRELLDGKRFRELKGVL